MKYELGQKVKHASSGMVGVITGRVEFDGNTYEYAVQPPFTADGRFVQPIWIRESELELAEDAAPSKPAKGKPTKKNLNL